ncbi:MAG: SDR family oxidoreductase [Bacteroidales bacterium]|nr:SDR family oxidoreductase [Bacteroidales bacterium]
MMELGIKDKLFIVTGASSGMGLGVVRHLIGEGARVVALARNKERLSEAGRQLGSLFEPVCGDITTPETAETLISHLDGRIPSGIFLNSGGPPATHFLETGMEQWDDAYRSVFRWKVILLKHFLPMMITRRYGRILLLESVSVKQPVKGLILSNSFRSAVAGLVKTISNETAQYGVTINILAPGYHDTPAVKRVFKKTSAEKGITADQARQQAISGIPVGRMGTSDEIGAMAAWLLSVHSGYITGQVISADGGLVRSTFG